MRFFILQVALAVAVAVAAEEDAGAAERRYQLCFVPSSSTMSCSGTGIAQAPSGHWPDIVVLYLAKDNIEALHANALSGFPNVYLLYLQDNRISQLDLQVFSPMGELTFLFLDNNRISSISGAAGARLGKLSHLYLSENAIASLDPELLSAAPNLQLLQLDSNPLVVPDGQPLLSNNPKVQVLHLRREGSLGRLGEQSLQGLPALQEALMDDAGVSDVTGAFVANLQLSVVSLEGNLITELQPGTFPATGNVTEVRLGRNPLQRVHVSALHSTLAPGAATVSIDDTPLACACAYDALYWWARGRGVALSALCGGEDLCSFL